MLEAKIESQWSLPVWSYSLFPLNIQAGRASELQKEVWGWSQVKLVQTTWVLLNFSVQIKLDLKRPLGNSYMLYRILPCSNGSKVWEQLGKARSWRELFQVMNHSVNILPISGCCWLGWVFYGSIHKEDSSGKDNILENSPPSSVIILDSRWWSQEWGAKGGGHSLILVLLLGIRGGRNHNAPSKAGSWSFSPDHTF